ncbi:demethylmenaquinone methyltransferase/2-methoxy-6-polyprenyl-1,4-benzoquinol methylase [Aneurinibacillus soli]|uniref:Demethylmenaquinone methyltransferase n=1 Tax=Aneurinibacillus soli TaxID=1500254 RepID=A0A0U4NJG0_9BACL|nr:demethylmenaquinone methyltransferase [Aneurinibacillus soli]PYE63041.1 demethylmenaquinone methyltransferase/2-methoxy-6-polyprenyl-1,4-benzoquinol methylase [Aneurinibacillus soli]BAU28900.1 Demethylmenaquinone methyltransferase [Aneurinibacillus soli]
MQENLQGDKKAEYVHSVFESIAKEYDRMNSVISFGRHVAWREYTNKRMGVSTGEKAIDLCCGTCDWTISLAEAIGPTGEVVGLDFSQNMLDVGAQKIKTKQLDQITLVNGDAMSIPYPDNTFDYATIGFALRNVPDYKQVIREMMRVVKPGGQVVSLEVSKPPFAPYRKLFYFYFYNILPFVARMTVNKYEEYNWLPNSLTNFPDSRKLADAFREVGLVNVETKLFVGGVSALHIGHKERVSES